MTKEQIKAKAKEQFPNDEFKQQIVIDAINWATKDLEKENAELKGLKDVATLIRANNDTVITLMQLNNMIVSKNQQLTKATKIIKNLIAIYYDPVVLESDIELHKKIITEAKQFISEVKKC